MFIFTQNSIQMSFDSKFGKITTVIQNKVAAITFGSSASNSFRTALLQELTLIFNDLSVDKNVTVIVLNSHGNKVFCSGASFDELLLIDNFEQGKSFFMGFANLINAMRQCSKTIVGRIHGKTIGGGVGIAAACDYVFATTAASIKLSELEIGIGPFVIEPAVSRKIGLAAMATLSLDATNWKSAQWAFEKGLFSEIFDDELSMDLAVEKFILQLSTYNIDALSEFKKVFWQNTDNWHDLLAERAAISGQLILSDFSKKALQNLKAK